MNPAIANEMDAVQWPELAESGKFGFGRDNAVSDIHLGSRRFSQEDRSSRSASAARAISVRWTARDHEPRLDICGVLSASKEHSLRIACLRASQLNRHLGEFLHTSVERLPQLLYSLPRKCGKAVAGLLRVDSMSERVQSVQVALVNAADARRSLRERPAKRIA